MGEGIVDGGKLYRSWPEIQEDMKYFDSDRIIVLGVALNQALDFLELALKEPAADNAEDFNEMLRKIRKEFIEEQIVHLRKVLDNE